MTNLAHWQDDIDEALGGDFDGSLSGLCIMSLSFDFTRNGGASHMAANNLGNHQASGSSLASMNNKPNTTSSCMNHEAMSENSNNCFKRFKLSAATNDNNQDDEMNRSNNQNKIARQMQQLKNCLTTTAATPSLMNSSSNLTVSNVLPNVSAEAQGQVENQDEPDDRLSSPHSSVVSCHRASAALSTTNESSRPSTVDPRSPSPQSCSSISTHSNPSSRSQSPSDMSIHSCNNNNNAGNNNNINNNEMRNNLNGTHTVQHHRGKNAYNHQVGETHRHGANPNDNQQVSIYSVKDNLLNGSTLKESSYTTSVITTTAPMHFKSLHHPFSLKQFPLSPYHQFSNSSLNHDLYDRYLSHDSHQPLQTPLIGIERTQDLLSLKLPPHGPDEPDSQKFPKEWSFDDHGTYKHDNNQNRTTSDEKRSRRDNSLDDCNSNNNNQQGVSVKGKETGRDSALGGAQKGFPFNYKIRSSTTSSDEANCQREPIDLNVSYEQDDNCCNNEDKNSIFNESMKHFNPERVQQNTCFNLRSKNDSLNHNDNSGNDEAENATNIAHQQYLGQESMFGIDPSKQKFQYLLAAPISVATKHGEDTMTYLNQGQAYEIKLENTTDVAEARKGFMCSIINIGFHERHMQQAENELWQQWSQQHPNEKIFSVDMKLSYNVFGVESDGLNKYEFLWDSSKAAGVFIRINSISTEFTPKKHGGEKGVPFKLSIETFSYNSKTHDSYFISAACCQIKIFKPKGAERKIRSDRDKISKKPLVEQEKYHRSCDHTIFKECSLTSLHPMADGSLCYYRHSHGHFASKQIAPTNNTTPSVQNQQSTSQQIEEEVGHNNNSSQQDLSPPDDNNQSPVQNRTNQGSNDSDTSSNDHQGSSANQRSNYPGNDSRQLPPEASGKLHQTDYPTSRLIQQQMQFGRYNPENHTDHPPDHNSHYGQQQGGGQSASNESNFNHSSDMCQLQQQQANSFNQMYHGNTRAVAGSLASINGSQHFGMSYYGHTLSNSHVPTTSSAYGGLPTSTTFSSAYPSHSGPHSFLAPPHQNVSKNSPPSIQRTSSAEKQPSIGPSGATSLKASNLALANHSNNFQSYPGNQTDPQCIESSLHDMKDGSINGNYNHHDNHDLHSHHNFHPTAGSHNHNLPSRYRSASMTTATANNHCTAYSCNQARHLDSYSGHTTTGTTLNCNTVNANHWIYGSTNHNSQLESPNSVYNQRSVNTTAGLTQSHDNHNNGYNNSHNFECNQHYDSEQNSPIKNHHTNDSSSSCISKFRNNSNSIVTHSNSQSHYEGNRSNFNGGHQITMSSNCNEVVSWFTANRFGVFCKTFSNFSGSDLLRLSKTDLIEICGLIDGIRLFNSLHNQPIKPRRVLYVCHQSNEIFHPIYLYDLSLKELLEELSIVFNSYLPHGDNQQHIDEKQQKKLVDKSTINSSSSTDSRSSMGALSTENGPDEMYGQGDNFFNDIDMQRKSNPSGIKSSNLESNGMTRVSIDRLLIDGITSVKIVATEQVVQILENESVWTLSISTGNSQIVEACISACHAKRFSK